MGDGLSASGRRRKGVRGEREVAAKWEAEGLEVRGLEGSGDHLVVSPGRVCPGSWRTSSVAIHSEVKRQERLRIPEWIRQAENEAPAGAIAVVSFRQSGGRWYSCLALDDLVALVAR